MSQTYIFRLFIGVILTLSIAANIDTYIKYQNCLMLLYAYETDDAYHQVEDIQKDTERFNQILKDYGNLVLKRGGK